MTESLEASFITFIRQHQQAIYRMAFSYTKNEQDALDVVQDSIQKGWRAIDTLKKNEQMKSWFYTILVRTAIDFLRKHQRIVLIGDEALQQIPEHDTYENLDLQQAIHQLPLQLREIIILRYFEDLKIEEIAQILNLPAGTVKSRLYKALRLLKVELDQEEMIQHA